jgi:hypothetical protein
MTPEQEARARNALFFGLSISACLWLIIGAVVWSLMQ